MHLPDLVHVGVVRPQAVVVGVQALPDVAALAVGQAGRRPVGAVAAVAAVALKVRSEGPVVRLGVAASRRSSVAKNSTRWRRHRLAASGSSRATARRSGSPGERH